MAAYDTYMSDYTEEIVLNFRSFSVGNIYPRCRPTYIYYSVVIFDILGLFVMVDSFNNLDVINDDIKLFVGSGCGGDIY